MVTNEGRRAPIAASWNRVVGSIVAAAPRYRRPLRDALIVVGLLRAAWYFGVQGIQPWTFAGIDARAYWSVDLDDLYGSSVLFDHSEYLYSPAFAQVIAPFTALPFEVFFALWTAVSVAILVWLVRPWPWAVPMLILPIVYELCVGNIHFLLAAATIAALRQPAVWAFHVLTKITPGVGSLWFLGRGEWKRFAAAVAVTIAIVAVSFVLAPEAWREWFEFLLASPGRTEALPLRVVLAAALVLVGARKGMAWTVAVAVWLALPVIYVNSWVILLAVIRLRTRRPERGATPASPRSPEHAPA